MGQKKVVVIGGGPGGYVAAIRAAQLGGRVTLVERDRIGGTCLNRGCIPTKALLSDGKLLRSLKRSPIFHPLLPEDFNPLDSMMERKRKVVDEMVKGVELLLQSHRITIKYGQADLLGTNQIVFLNRDGTEETIDADGIILAPGSRTKVLSHLAPDGDKIITSDEILEIRRVPREILIVGGGYIGVEFAALFSALGSKVTIVEILESILPGLEGELVRNLLRIFEKDGVMVYPKSSMEGIHPQGEGLKVTLKTPQGMREVVVEKLLLSVGRVPNLKLGFSRAGVEVSPSGIKVNRRMGTTAPQIYAIGDAIGGMMLAHIASEEGIVAAENLMGIGREMENLQIPACIFTYPEIASIGLSEREARARGEIQIGRFPFRSNPKAIVSEETEGLIKVVADRETDEILGIHIIGPEASTLISTASTMMNEGVKAKQFTRLVQVHPTLPEALKEAVLDVNGAAIHLPKPLRGQK
ncbi:MAG: dihydrolipoyl dehydrogenase [Deltaproteobacteria bacterium RBG_16_48_10]|nr:MAG: dihydrolipoyl dehydrogenase [Deltaproteobacteria bacterium RBG_16_48_10]